jgi:hypothetical protein
MNKILVYKTDYTLTANILNFFSDSINKYIKGWKSECVHIENFIQHGIPEDVNAIATFGILRGTGHLLKEAAANNIDRYFIDHAYFEPGYEGKCWLRISKNKHTINYIKDISSYRWDNFFSEKNTIKPWQKFEQRGSQILIIPPTNAICWYFDEHKWEENILNYLKKTVNRENYKNIKIRYKPNEPIVDKNGHYLGLRQNSKIENVPLEDDLKNSSLVIAYNSQVALDATLKGIPVIVDKHNSCFEISFKLSDIEKGLNNPVFDIEPDRLGLCKWLSYCQYNLEEIKSGFAWKTIHNFQN